MDRFTTHTLWHLRLTSRGKWPAGSCAVIIWAVSVRAPAHNYLSPEEAKRFYDRLGSAQDWQCFYENPAFSEIIAHAGLESVHPVFEFGSGRYVHPQRKDERGEHDASG